MYAGRKLHSIRNLIFGIIYQVINLILSFVCRTLLIWKLGNGILGINSLYSNILTLLSLAELGISNVFLFKLYKPIAEGDDELLSQYMRFYKKVYNIIALVVCILGLLFIPFLKYIVSNDVVISNSDLIIYYLLFLTSTVVSYFLVYKQMLINANQDLYILKIVNLITLIVQTVLRIIFLIVYPNYKIYIIIEIISVLLSNLVLHFYVDKKFPQLKRYRTNLSKENKKDLIIKVKDTFLYRLGGVLITNTDSIIISSVLSTLLVGYLSNYNLIITAINGIVSVITNALFSSVGNLALEHNSVKSKQIFNVMLLIYQYIGCFCAIGMLCTFNDFITMWLKSPEFLLDFSVVFALCANFYLTTVISPVYIFRENNGLFAKVKYLLLIAAAINIVTSVILAQLLGLLGVILGTIICRLLTTIIFEPPILYKEVFKSSPKEYFFKQLKAFIITIIVGATIYFINKLIPIGFGYFILKIIITFLIVSIAFTIAYCKTSEYKYIKNLIKELFAKLKNNNKKRT
ncbi:MAG: lipopolysaccharide biosynthesis protein [Candidatus Onthoplasma sp.]